MSHDAQPDPIGDFAPAELDRLLAEGEADLKNGDFYDGEQVFRELEQLSAARREQREEGHLPCIARDSSPTAI